MAFTRFTIPTSNGGSARYDTRRRIVVIVSPPDEAPGEEAEEREGDEQRLPLDLAPLQATRPVGTPGSAAEQRHERGVEHGVGDVGLEGGATREGAARRHDVRAREERPPEAQDEHLCERGAGVLHPGGG